MDKSKPAPRALAVEVEKNKSVPAPEDVSTAARQLAMLPRRRKRIWSGWLNSDTRSYRNMRIAIPNGQQVFVYGVLRGRAVYTVEPNGPAGDPFTAGVDWGVLPAGVVEIIRNPHAALLGQLKRGASERRSELKAASARANGNRPCRDGRKRGRPRIAKLVVTTAGLSTQH